MNGELCCWTGFATPSETFDLCHYEGSHLKRDGRGCKPRPAKFLKRDGRGCKPRPANS